MRRINPVIEAVIIIVFILQLLLMLINGKTILVLLIVEVFIYSMLTLIFYYVLSPRILNAEPKVTLRMERKKIADEEALIYRQKVVSLYGMLKLTVILFLVSAALIEVYEIEKQLPFAFALAFILFISAMSACIYFLTRSMMLFKGYVNFTARDVLTQALFYYNPDDKRAVVDKPFGAGSTINFATKQGRLIFWVIMSIPMTFLLILVLVLLLKK